tara:strand:+ start:1063 stop:2544 length:1482 start_codon:yes stop_codon:yes gene_type:complete
MIDIVLINLNRINKVGIFTLASYCRSKSLKVKIIDGCYEGILSKFKELNDQHQILAVGLTATTDAIEAVIKLGAKLKQINPNLFLISGGYHSTILPKETLGNSDFDIAVVREGEITLAEILFKLKKGVFPTKEPGCYEKIDHQLIFNDYRSFVAELDSLPYPAYDLVDIKKYFHAIRKEGGLEKVIVLLISRGCPFDCVFCGSKNMWCRQFRMYSVDYVIKLVNQLIGEYDIDGISFLDDELVTNRKYISQLCNRFISEGISRKIKWSCHSRVSSINLEVLEKMKQAGCILIRFGLESGSENILSYLKKNTVKTTQAYEAISLCKKVGIPCFGSFILGSPDETVDDVLKTIDFIQNSGLSSADIFSLVPYPGTDIYQFAQKHNLIKKDIQWKDFKIEGDQTHSVLNTFHFTAQQIDQIRSYIDLNIIDRLNNGLAFKRLNHREEIGKILKGNLSKTEFSWQGRQIIKLRKILRKIKKAIFHPGLVIKWAQQKI